ncbi:MAG TPA: NHL repeat-containing protein [Polyangia bacterium]
MRLIVALAMLGAAPGCREAPRPAGAPAPSRAPDWPGAPRPVGAPTPDRGRFVAPTGASLQYPTRAAVAPDGTVYVSDARANAVYGYLAGRATVELQDVPQPLGVAVHGTRLYVGSQERRGVEVYDLGTRVYVQDLGAGDLAMPNAIAVAPDGSEVYVADSRRDRVAVYAPDGRQLGTIGEPGEGPGQLRFPTAVAADAARIVVADQGNHRVQVFRRDRRHGLSFGAELTDPGRPLTDADVRGRFTRLQGVALAGGRIVVLDAAEALLQVFDGQGAHQGFAGGRALDPPLWLDVQAGPGGTLILTDATARRLVTTSLELRPAP